MKYTADNLYSKYRDTEYGERLSLSCRYSDFIPPDWTVEQWEKLLGSNMNNLRHMKMSSFIAERFVEIENQLSPPNARQFFIDRAVKMTVTAVVHDQAEAEEIIGDINYTHTPEDYDVLQRIAMRTKGLTDYVPGTEGKQAELYLAAAETAIPDKRPRGKIYHEDEDVRAFFGIECIGYLHDMTSASRRFRQLDAHLHGRRLTKNKMQAMGVNEEAEIPELQIRIYGMIAQILSNGIVSNLVILGDEFPSLHLYLNEIKDRIDWAMSFVDENIFDWIDTERNGTTDANTEIQKEKFRVEKEMWFTQYRNYVQKTDEWHPCSDVLFAIPSSLVLAGRQREMLPKVA